MNTKKNRNYVLIIGAVMLGIAIFVALLSLVYTPYDPNAISATEKFIAPCLKHPLGTDNLGRDILSRTMLGLRTTIMVSGIAIAFAASIGLVIGAYAGYHGGLFDEILMRINDAVASIPAILLAMVLIGVMGRGTKTVIYALGIAFIPSYARMVRGEFINIRHRKYIDSARLMGASRPRIMFGHILPNIMSTFLATIAVGLNNAVLTEAGMSFMGVGVVPPTPSLGEMLSSAQSFWSIAPWYAIFPGLAIIYLIVSLVIFSEGIKSR